MNPKISIIMSTYNDEKYIEKALKSILSQTFEDWQLILINDASTDRTEQIINKLLGHDKRLKYIINRTRKGVTRNIKTAIKLAKSKYIARIDGDDYWLDTKKLDDQYQKMEADQTLGLVGTWAKVVDNAGAELYRIEYPSDDKIIRNRILYENTFVTSSILFRKLSNLEIHNINPLNKFADDFNLVLQIGTKKKFSNIKKYYTAYRVNPKGISQSKSKEQLSDTLRIVKFYRNYYPNYFRALMLWSLRKLYPAWLKGELSMKVKKIIGYYNEEK